MPVNKLYVEGKLDSEIYTPLLSDSLLVVRGGSKNSLRPQALNDRSAGIQAGYLRDRDFDFDPPKAIDVPTVDASDADQPWGWRLNRHEIESYLLDPKVVEAKFSVKAEAWQEHLCEAARRIRWYQMARWTVGYARSRLPPHYKLQTKSDDVPEMRLPQDLSEQASLEWCRETIRKFLTMIDQCLCDDAVGEQIELRRPQFSDELLVNHQHVLQWCSGKDLFASISDAALQATKTQSAQLLCNILRDWVRANPNELFAFFPEFAAIKQQMTGSPSLRDFNLETRPLRAIELADGNIS